MRLGWGSSIARIIRQQNFQIVTHSSSISLASNLLYEEWLDRVQTYLPLPTSHRNIDESPRVCDSLLCAALWGLLLFLWFNLKDEEGLAKGFAWVDG